VNRVQQAGARSRRLLFVANQRENANGVDLNRDYGYFWDGWGNSPGPNSQIENKLMIQHLEQNNISFEFNYHSAAEYVNYPWDYHQADPADSQYIILLSDVYSDSAGLPIINGWDWYQVNGSMQDYSIGTSGVLAWTVETDEPFGSSSIDQICYNNRDALMDLSNRAGWGITGVVKDSLTDTPLYARIETINPERIDIYTDPVLGDFHKMIAQGTYDLRISANGYEPKTIDNVLVPATGSIELGNILLYPDTIYQYAFRVVITRYASHSEQNNKTQPRFALGAEDDRFFSLGRNGYIILDMGQNTPITDIPGVDFVVYEGNDGTQEGYNVYVSNNWNGPWTSCGSGSGTVSFDLATTGLTEARFLKIVDDGSTTSGQYAGFDLDAVEFFRLTGIEETANPINYSRNPKISVSPNPSRSQIKIAIDKVSNDKNGTLKIFDLAGKLIKTFSLPFVKYNQPISISWDRSDVKGNEVRPGIYFIYYRAGHEQVCVKVILTR